MPVPSSSPREYWNDSLAEQGKAYAVSSLEDARLKQWVGERTNLQRCFVDGLEFLTGRLGWRGGRVLDVASGVCWTSAIISRRTDVSEVIAVDFSRHRIEVHAPLVIRQFEGDENKIQRVVGDALTATQNKPVDLIVFNQALYMFNQPAAFLRKSHAMLRGGGMVMVSCERIEPEYRFGSVAYWKQLAREAVRGKEDETGRVRMLDKDYCAALTDAGFSYRFQALDYPVFPETNRWLAGNYFGIK